MGDQLLKGRVALVTGGSRGIGAASCLRLAEHGASVIVNYKSNHQAAARVVERIRAAGGNALAIQADVSQEEQVRALVEQAKRELGLVDILVNNAWPGFQAGDISDVPWTTYQMYFDQMVQAAYHAIRAVLPGMKERRWGRIVNFGTTSMYEVCDHHTAYITSKGALVALTRGLAKDLGPYGICVNLVTPSLVYTKAEPQPEGWGRARAERSAFGRHPTAWEVAGAVVFLASPLADAVTGIQLPVATGLMMHVG